MPGGCVDAVDWHDPLVALFADRRLTCRSPRHAALRQDTQGLTGCGWTRSGSGRNEDNRRLAEPVAGNGGAVARDGDDLDGDERMGSRGVEGLHCVGAVPA